MTLVISTSVPVFYKLHLARAVSVLLLQKSRIVVLDIMGILSRSGKMTYKEISGRSNFSLHVSSSKGFREFLIAQSSNALKSKKKGSSHYYPQ